MAAPKKKKPEPEAEVPKAEVAEPEGEGTKLTRTIRVEVKLADVRKADRPALTYRLAVTAGYLMEGANRAAFALASVFMKAVPWPTEPDPKDPGRERRINARSLAYMALSGKWQPHGESLYNPPPEYRASGSVLSVMAGEILTRLTGSSSGVGPLGVKERARREAKGEVVPEDALSAKAHWWDTVRGRRAFPGFNIRRGGFPLRNDSLDLSREDGVVVVKLWSAESPKGSRAVAVRPWYRRDGSASETLRRIRAGRYKMGGGALTYDPQKKKWFLSVAWTDSNVADLVPQVPLIAGVDVNVIKTAVLAYIRQVPDPARAPTLCAALGIPDEAFLPEGFLAHAKSPRRGKAYQWLGFVLGTDRFDLPDNVLRAWDRIDGEKAQRQRTNRAEYALRVGRGRQRKLRVSSNLREKASDISRTAIEQLVAAALRTAMRKGAVAVVTEDLQRWSVTKAMTDTHEQSDGQARRARRRWYLRWHQGALRAQFAAVAARKGMTHTAVNPASSRICSVCARYYTEVTWQTGPDGQFLLDKQGRKIPKWGYFSNRDFRCACGIRMDGDRNAALVLARRARGELGLNLKELLPMDAKAAAILRRGPKQQEEEDYASA